MDKVRTLSDTKRNFYNHHTRPIHSIFRRVVEELLVEMHLLSVNVDFHYDPIYALGVVSSYDRFMEAYRPENDKNSIFTALCQSIGGDPHQYRQDAERMSAIADSVSGEQLMNILTTQTPMDGAGDLSEIIRGVADNSKFKYSRLFAIGLYTLLQKADSTLVEDQKHRQENFSKVCSALNLPSEKLEKDLELYRSNLEKMAQAQSALEDALQAARKQRQKRALEKETAPDRQESPSSGAS